MGMITYVLGTQQIRYQRYSTSMSYEIFTQFLRFVLFKWCQLCVHSSALCTHILQDYFAGTGAMVWLFRVPAK